jgi:uncharacterized protein (TIGR03118 family)
VRRHTCGAEMGDGMRKAAALSAVAAFAALTWTSVGPATATTDAMATVQVHKLVSDQPGAAQITDPNLVNAWGLALSPSSPLWVSDNGSDSSTIYATSGSSVSKVPLTVSVPSAAPTGAMFNDTSAFVVPGTGQPALFLFATETGKIAAWNPATGTVAKTVASVRGAVFKGLAIAHSPFGPLLLATDFHNGRVSVFDSSFTRLSVPGLFRDSALPAGYAPFNVMEVGKRVYVTYAKQDADAHDDVPGLGHGFVDVYTNFGAFLSRLVSRGALDSPWGMAVAPNGFGPLAGKLLIGNFGNGRIHVYNRWSGSMVATLHAQSGRPLVIDGLWGLAVGNATAGGSDAVWFSAGPDGEAHGLLGTLTAP